MPSSQPDYSRMLEHLARAQAALRDAVTSMHSMDKMSHLESYVLGHIRAVEAALREAIDSIQKTEASKRRRQSSEKEPES